MQKESGDVQPRKPLPPLITFLCPSFIYFRLLVDAVVHFPLTQAEVTLGASPSGKVTLRSYLEEETGELPAVTRLPSYPQSPSKDGILNLPLSRTFRSHMRASYMCN